MAFQPVPHTITLIMRFISVQQAKAQMDFSFQFGGVPTQQELDDICGSASTAYTQNLSTVMSHDWALYEIEARSEDAAANIKSILRIDPAESGGLQNPSVPANATFAVKFTIANRGRGRSGRVFMIGLDETQVDTGYLNQTYAGGVVQEVRDFAQSIELDSGADHVVVHRYEGTPPVPLPAGVPASVIGYSYADLAVDSQKLRLPNHKKRRKPRTTP